MKSKLFIVKRPNEQNCGSTRFTMWSLKVEFVTNGYTKQKIRKKHTVKLKLNTKEEKIQKIIMCRFPEIPIADIMETD